MPNQLWRPRSKFLEEQLGDETTKLQSLWATQQSPPPVDTQLPRTLWGFRDTTNSNTIPIQKLPKPDEEPVSLPFWERSLQVFGAPFYWVDENIIKPGLSLGFTASGLVENVEREAGEDFWEWKKRSWEGWDAPGIDINVPWSDKPWRVDVKGVMELAPWLLIPGFGQVGGATGIGARLAGKAGTRIASGLVGKVGKFGIPGRVVGTVIEYSPWGLAEKTIGAVGRAAIAGGLRAISGTGTRLAEKIIGKIPERPMTPAVKQLSDIFTEQVAPQYKAFRKEVPALRVRQESAASEWLDRARRGEITSIKAFEGAAKARAGGIKSEFAIKGGQMSTKSTRELLDVVVKAHESGLVSTDAGVALVELLNHGVLPQPHNVRDFARIFGNEFAQSLKKLEGVPASMKDQLWDALNLPRSVLASVDISGVARQGAILGLTHPTQVPRAFGRMMKALFSEKSALEMDDVLRGTTTYREFLQAGGYVAPIAKGAKIGAREEAYASQLAEKIPFVRRSERAFITYLNELRVGSFKAASASYKAQGAGKKELSDLARFITLASGRGDLPAGLNKYAPVLNSVLFSARLQMSRLQLPKQLGRMLLSKNPYERKEAAKALVTFIGGGTALLTLLNTRDDVSVEIDPRSGDFGKIKIGDTRLDIWTGYLQYTRFAAQMLTGESKSAYGNMSTVERSKVASRFLQSKSSPAFGLLVDLMKGENYMGEPLFEGTTGVIKMARDRLMPLALQDVMDAMEQGGINQAWTAIPAELGIGTLTYVNDLVKVKEKIANDMNLDSWDDIDPKTQREIENSNVELQAAYITYDRQVMGTAWGDWRNAGNAIEDVFKENVDSATNQYRATNDGVQFRGKIEDAFTERRGGYSAREKELRFEDITRRLNIKDTAEALVSLGPEQMAIKTYNDALYADDMYDEFGDYRFDEADIRKGQLKSSLGEEMFDYVEEYRGEKYASLPEEYQQLARAKIVMKPYWAIQTQIEQRFGRKLDSMPLLMQRRAQALITRMRQILRMRNPEIAMAYEKFYAR